MRPAVKFSYRRAVLTRTKKDGRRKLELCRKDNEPQNMRDVLPLAERLSPDTATKLERAAGQRYATAELLRSLPQPRRLAALYFYGYSVEMWLSAAYFRSAGFKPHEPIHRDTRLRRMAQARQLRLASGEAVMNSDPHPLVGWARFLQWQRSASGKLTMPEVQRLREAINRAIRIYNSWRPELRYKVLEITDDQLSLVREAATWFKTHQAKLWEA